MKSRAGSIQQGGGGSGDDSTLPNESSLEGEDMEK